MRLAISHASMSSTYSYKKVTRYHQQLIVASWCEEVCGGHVTLHAKCRSLVMNICDTFRINALRRQTKNAMREQRGSDKVRFAAMHALSAAVNIRRVARSTCLPLSA